MTDATVISHAEALAEIKRLRARVTDLEAVLATYQTSLSSRSDQLFEMLTQRARLENRITELEVEAAIARGTLAKPTPDEPAGFTGNLPPNAPPHNE